MSTTIDDIDTELSTQEQKPSPDAPQYGPPEPATAADLDIAAEFAPQGDFAAPDDSELYGPPEEIFTRDDATLPERVRGRLTTAQVDFAVGQEQDPRMQMDLFTYTNNFQGAIRRMQQLGLPDKLEAERIHKEAGIPEGMVERIRRHAPKEMDDLEVYRVAAGLYELVGPESYTYRMFTGDPEFAANWISHAKLYGELDRSIQTAFASNAEIMAKWFAGSAASLANSIITGIPAAFFQAGAEMRGRDLKPRQEMAEPAEYDNPAELLFAQGLNQQIREQNAELEKWRTDPEHIAQAQANQAVFDVVNEVVQEVHEAGSALTHLPPAKTGNPVTDTYARPIVQGLGSYLPSMGMGILARGAVSLPAFIFGLAEASDVYRENSAAGIDPVSNIFTSVSMGLLSGFAERFTLGTSLKSPGLMSLVRRTGGNTNSLLPRVGRILGGGIMSAGSEAGAEGIQTGLGIAAKPLARTLSFGDPIKNVWTELVDNADQIGESMWGGGGAGLLGGAGIGRSGMEFANGLKYAKFQKNGGEIAKAADTLIQAKGDVQAVRTEIRHLIADGQKQGKTGMAPKVYADAGDVKHTIDGMSEADAEAFLADIGVSRAAYEQAMENGVDIEARTENVLALASDDAQQVRALFRPNPTMESASFLRRQYAETESLFALASQLQNTLEADIEQGKAPEVVAQFYQGLKNTDGMTPAEAKAQASMLWAWAQTQGKRRNVDPEAILRNEQIRASLDTILGGTPKPIGNALLQGETDATAIPLRIDEEQGGSTAERVISSDDNIQGESDRAHGDVAVQPGTQAWNDEAAANLLSSLGLDGEEYAPLAQGVREAIAAGQDLPDVRGLADGMGIALPESSVRGIEIMRAAGPDAAIQDALTASDVATEDIPVLGDYLRQVQEAGQVDVAQSPDAVAAMGREVEAAGKESRRLDAAADAIERALEFGYAVDLLTEQGRGKLHALKTDQAATLAEQKRILLSTLQALPDRKSPDGGGILAGLRRSGERFIVSNLQAERILAEADGNPMLQGREMGLMQTLGNIIRQSEVKQRQMLAQFKADSAKDFAILDALERRLHKQFGGKNFTVNGVDAPRLLREKRGVVNWNADMLEAVFFNMGNRGNLHALEQGHGLAYEQLRQLASLATEAEWRAIERIGKRMGQFYPLHNAVHLHQTGRPLQAVQASPFTVATADGKTITLDGWYYPLHYDWKLSPPESRGQQVNMADAEYDAAMESLIEPARADAGFTHERQTDAYGNPVVARPQILSMRVMTSHLTSATRWLTHAEPLGEFRRLLMDQDVKELFIKKLGEEKYRELRVWTNRQSRPAKGATAGANKAFGLIRDVSTMRKVAGNIGAAVGMAKYLGNAADMMSNASRTKASGWHWLLQGFKHLGLDGFLGGWVGYQNDAIREMRALSPEADARSKAFSKEISESLGEDGITGKKKGLGAVRPRKRLLYHFAFAVNQAVSGMTWWGAYHQATEGHAGFDVAGLTDAQIQEKAIAFADAMVRSQSSPLSADYSNLQANPGAVSLMTQFMGGAAARLSHTYGLARLWRQGGKSTGDMARHVTNAYAIPVAVKIMLADVLWGALTGDDDDEDKSLSSALAWGMVNEASEGLPFVRTAARQGSRAAKRLSNTVEHLADGEMEEAIDDFGGALSAVVPLATRRRP